MTLKRHNRSDISINLILRISILFLEFVKISKLLRAQTFLFHSHLQNLLGTLMKVCFTYNSGHGIVSQRSENGLLSPSLVLQLFDRTWGGTALTGRGMLSLHLNILVALSLFVICSLTVLVICEYDIKYFPVQRKMHLSGRKCHTGSP